VSANPQINNSEPETEKPPFGDGGFPESSEPLTALPGATKPNALNTRVCPDFSGVKLSMGGSVPQARPTQGREHG
jgi:hypothetical protein